MVCDRCGQRFTGTLATGRSSTYAYYTYGNRQRYGTASCSADRLPAEALERAVLDQLLALHANPEDLLEAARRASGSKSSNRRRHQDELATIDCELQKAKQTAERYLDAFEAGDLSPDVCGQRLQAIQGRMTALERRKNEVSELLEVTSVNLPTQAELQTMLEAIRSVLTDGPRPFAKQVLQRLIHEVRAEGRHTIHPVFKIPVPDQEREAVRAPSALVDPGLLLCQAAAPMSFAAAGSASARRAR